MDGQTLQVENIRDAIHRLFAKELRDGFKLAGCHRYNDADGNELFRRVRLKRGDTKHIRPMHRDGMRYGIGELPAPPQGKHLYVPPYPLVETDPVFVVEGEACADALAKLGLTAITSGSCSSADAADWTPLRGRAITIWPDNDWPGTGYAAAVVSKLLALGCDVRLVGREVVESLPEGGDVVDWIAQYPDATADTIRALPTTEPATVATAAAEPEPLRRPLPPAAPYPLDALGGALRDAARAIHEVVKAPAAMCGTSILAAASLAAQHLANVKHDSFNEPLSLWAVTIGVSGERKSAVDKWALGAHYQHEKAAQPDYDAAVKAFTVEQAAYRAAVAKAKGGGRKANRASIRAALESVGPEPEPPVVPLLVMSEPTLEGAQKQLIKGWPSVGLFSSDAGEFWGGFSMSAEQKTRTAASLSKLWDNGTFDRLRAKADEVGGKFYGKRVALHFMVQPVIAEAVLSDATLAGQGFLPRCLLAWPETVIGTRDYVGEDLHDNPAVRRYWAKVHALLNRDYPLADGKRNELEPRALGLTADAGALWVQFQNATEHALAEGGQFASVQAWGSKAGAQVLRVAGVLTLFDNPDAGAIERDAIERAAELVLWHLSEAVRTVGTAAVPREVQDAEALLDWCHKERVTLLCSADALQFGPGCIRTKRAFDAAMQELERAGWAVPVEGGAVVGNKQRRRVWRIVEGQP